MQFADPTSSVVNVERVTITNLFIVKIDDSEYPVSEVLSVINYGCRRNNHLFRSLCSALEDISELYSIWDFALISELASHLFGRQFPETCFIPEQPCNQLPAEYKSALMFQELSTVLNIIARFGRVPPGDKLRFTHEDHVRNIIHSVKVRGICTQFGYQWCTDLWEDYDNECESQNYQANCSF